MNIRIWAFALIATTFLMVLPGCWNVQQSKQTGLVVANVLDKKLYDDCHIKGSIHLSFEKAEQVAEQSIDKDAEIILYCSNYMCTTSSFVGKKLQSVGFTNVSVYEGGSAEWYQKGLPVEGPCKSSYLNRTVKPSGEDQGSIPVITAEQLARKMGVKSAQ